ncbi:MAG: hypothetical protein V4505_12850 [Pseudomonadota bacterium]
MHDHHLPRPLVTGPPAGRGSRWRTAGWVFVFLWFLLGGIAHFAATATEMRIVPPWIPWPRAAVLVSGVFELLGAAGLLWRPTRRAAGWGLFLLTLAVTPCHLYMLQQPDLFPAVPYWALWARLPVQAVLLALIAWSTVPVNGMEVAADGRVHRSSDRTP